MPSDYMNDNTTGWGNNNPRTTNNNVVTPPVTSPAPVTTPANSNPTTTVGQDGVLWGTTTPVTGSPNTDTINKTATSNTSTTPTSSTTPTTSPITVPLSQVVPGKTAGNTQMNVQDYAGQVAHDPQTAFSNEMILSKSTPTFSQSQTDAGTVASQSPINAGALNQNTAQGTISPAAMVDPRLAANYTAQTTEPAVSANTMTGATGTVSQGSQVNIREIDTEATGQGLNEVGKALNAAAILDLNDVDARSTLKGQIDILQQEFQDTDGNPVVPPWASGLARQVSKIAAFKGITGTAATAAMSQALLESSIKIAEQDAKFFQTVELTNLDNRQKSIINKANVLAQMDLANLDARTTAAVENAKNFMQMDMANLDNDQQARLINTQQRFQSILEDAKSVNAQRLFGAESENETNKFYDTLNSQLSQFNSTQMNAMSQFNAGEQNSMKEFNAKLEDSRDKFYREMQFNIDTANAEWRQKISTTETQMKFEAAAFDAKNMVDVSQEALNRIWDRSDSLLDYIWKSAENQLDRNTSLAVAKLQADASKSIANANKEAGDAAGLGQVFGTILGAIAGPLAAKWF